MKVFERERWLKDITIPKQVPVFKDDDDSMSDNEEAHIDVLRRWKLKEENNRIQNEAA